VGRLETALHGFQWESATSQGHGTIASDRRYERLLRLKQLHAKVRTRERLAVEASSPPPDRDALRRA
jgi:hypothetical protein